MIESRQKKERVPAMPARKASKCAGTQTTFIYAAGTVCDILNEIDAVTKILPRVIAMGTKLTNVTPGCEIKLITVNSSPGFLRLRVRDGSAVQTIHVYTTNVEETVDTLRRNIQRKWIGATVQERK
jgi:hypothetical protein